MILQPRIGSFTLPNPETSADLWRYVAEFNNALFFETDVNGVLLTELPATAYFFVDQITQATPDNVEQLVRYDGNLFIGLPAQYGTDINEATFDSGQYLDITQALLAKSFLQQLRGYIACDYKITFNSVRPLYNVTNYTRAVNSTGIEIKYSIWL